MEIFLGSAQARKPVVEGSEVKSTDYFEDLGSIPSTHMEDHNFP